MQSFTEFLINHSTKDKTKITHTRIGNIEMNIFPGKYHISAGSLQKFYKMYYNTTIKNGNKEYLTEKQREIGPVLVDLDFRYDTIFFDSEIFAIHMFDI